MDRKPHEQKPRCKKHCHDKWNSDGGDHPTFKKWEKKEKKELFTVMDVHFAKTAAKKEQEKATKEFAASSVTPSSDDDGSSGSGSE